VAEAARCTDEQDGTGWVVHRDLWHWHLFRW
jgi:hypothetical protein